jgi:hypothetical protein
MPDDPLTAARQQLHDAQAAAGWCMPTTVEQDAAIQAGWNAVIAAERAARDPKTIGAGRDHFGFLFTPEVRPPRRRGGQGAN